MAVVSMKQFLEAGVHFGHQTKRWNPKMRPYIYGARNGTHIIDLQKSLRMLKTAYEYVRDQAANGETVLFVGTKLQARDIIREEAERCGGFYINERWLGGLLTNFNTIKTSVAKMKKYEGLRGENGTYEGMIKKEALQLEKKRIKLEKALGGIRDMRRMPGALFVVDCKKEKIALQEAQTLGIPIVAVVDTNCDPDDINFVIPGNDDAIRSIRMFSHTIANAVLEGRSIYEARMKSAPEEKPSKGSKAKNAGKDTATKPASKPVTDDATATPAVAAEPEVKTSEAPEAPPVETPVAEAPAETAVAPETSATEPEAKPTE